MSEEKTSRRKSSVKAERRADMLGWSFGPQIQIYYLIAFWLMISAIAMYALTRTPLGRICNAVRDNPERVEFIGYDPHGRESGARPIKHRLHNVIADEFQYNDERYRPQHHDRPPFAGVLPALSSAARLMPARMRTYEAQRHM